MSEVQPGVWAPFLKDYAVSGCSVAIATMSTSPVGGARADVLLCLCIQFILVSTLSRTADLIRTSMP